jgi:hypothetical protein
MGMVVSDLMCHGIGVFLPLSEHQPYDLIAVRKDGAMSRVQVKYRTLQANGSIDIGFRSTYSDSNGFHQRAIDRFQFDCYAVYCPNNHKVYYIRNDDISRPDARYFSIRVLPPRGGQWKRVNMASQFEETIRIFD